MMNDNEQYDNCFNTSIPSYFRVIGIGKTTEGIFHTINSYKYEGVSGSVICNPSDCIPTDADKMVIIIALGDEEVANSIAKAYYNAGVLTLGLLKNADTSCYDSVLNEYSVGRLPEIVQNLIQPIATYGCLNFDLNDLCTILRNSHSFNTLTASGRSVEEAVSYMQEKLEMVAIQEVGSMSAHIYFNRERRTEIKMDDIAHLSDMISSMPESINVIWSVNFDDTLPEDNIRLTMIMSGKEL